MTNNLTRNLSNLISVRALLAKASAITVSDGPYLVDWDANDDIDTEDDSCNVLTCRTSFDNEDHYIAQESFDVGSFILGHWSEDGNKFILKNTDGEMSYLRFYDIKMISNTASDTQVNDSASDFLASLNAMVDESLNDLVSFMESKGWFKDSDDGLIKNNGASGSVYPDWVSAIKSCIDFEHQSW